MPATLVVLSVEGLSDVSGTDTPDVDRVRVEERAGLVGETASEEGEGALDRQSQ